MKLTPITALGALVASFGLTALFAVVVGWPDVLATGFLSACFQAIVIVCALAFRTIFGVLEHDADVRMFYPILSIGFWISAGLATVLGVAAWNLTNVREELDIMIDSFAMMVCLMIPGGSFYAWIHDDE